MFRNDRGVARAELFVAIAVAVLGLLLLSGTAEISPGVGYDRVGPRLFPFAVSAGLILLGCALVLSAMRVRSGGAETVAADADGERVNWKPVAYLGLAFSLFVALLERAGFVIASSIQFWLVARAFHSRRPARDAAAAVLISAIVYITFSRLLGLTLPAGVLPSFP